MDPEGLGKTDPEEDIDRLETMFAKGLILEEDYEKQKDAVTKAYRILVDADEDDSGKGRPHGIRS